MVGAKGSVTAHGAQSASRYRSSRKQASRAEQRSEAPPGCRKLQVGGDRIQAGRKSLIAADSSSAPSNTLPSEEAAIGSLARSGCGMSPTTLPSAFEIPAMPSKEP